MRFPWNRKYMEISFHIILTALILAVAGGILFRLSDAKNVILETAGNFLAVFAPLFWALFFSFLLEPLVSFFQGLYEKNTALCYCRRIRDRRAGTAFAYLAVGLFLFLLGSFLARKIGNTDIQEIILQITDYIRRIGDILVLLNLKLAEMGILSNVEGLLSLWTEQATRWIENGILGFANAIPNMGSGLLDLFIGLVAAFYFLMEKKYMMSFLGELAAVFLGRRAGTFLCSLFRQIYDVFSGYLSGQLLDATIISVLFSGAFLVVGLPHAVFLGLISGFSNLIPYFGAIVAFILAVFSGLLSGTPVKALYASVLILLLQQVDSMYIVPKVVGKRLELHPVLVLLSLAIFGRLFGFWGLLFAVPLGALGKNFVFWLYERKRK